MIAVGDRVIRTAVAGPRVECEGACKSCAVIVLAIGARDLNLCRRCALDLERRLFEHLWDYA